jgi:hypothetical protein
LRATPRASDSVTLLDAPASRVRPRPGRHYVDFDGRRGFLAVLRARGVVGPGTDPLRWYRSGPYAALVGTSAWAHSTYSPPVARATLDAPLRYQIVDHRARHAPWAIVHGRISAPPGTSVLVSANGVAAGVYTSQPTDRSGWSEYGGLLAPVLADGHNAIQLFILRGRVAAPVFENVTILAGPS